MKNQVPLEVRKFRNHLLREVFSEHASSYRQQFIGRTLPVLWEAVRQVSESGWQLEGWTGNYIRVSTNSPEPRWNRMDDVKLINLTNKGIKGEIV